MKRCVVRMMSLVALFAFPMSGVDAQALYAAESHSYSQNPASPRLVTIELRNVTIAEAVQAIARQAGVSVSVGDEVLSSARRISVKVQREALRPAIEKVLTGTPFRLQTTTAGAFFVNGESKRRAADDAVITGRVVHEKTKRPVSGARVSVDGGATTVETGEDGMFRITVKGGDYTLLVRALGFVKWSKAVVIEDGKTVTVPVELAPSASVLDEVVVTGTVIATKRKAIATPITVIHGEELEKRGITRIEQLFRGEVPGLLVLEQGSATYSDLETGQGVSATIYSRGSASLNGDANPIKTYVDGVELLDPSYLGTIDPSSIKRIEIVTGPQAATIYGSGAMGGVMQIFTKRGRADATPEITLSLKYGMLQNSFSSGFAPKHIDMLSVNGGTGPEMTYSGSVSYDYTGQWQPGLYDRRIGAALGVTHTSGRLTTSASMSTSMSNRGTWRVGWSNDYGMLSMLVGPEIITSDMMDLRASFHSNRTSISSSQVLSLNADFRLTPSWQHRITLGRSQSSTMLKPAGPRFSGYAVNTVGRDTLLEVDRNNGHRITWNYNTSYVSQLRMMSSSMTFGANGSFSDRISADGCKATSVSTELIGCFGTGSASVTLPFNDQSWGGFGQWQIGLWGQLYTTLGIRVEQNPNYGNAVKFDITPTNGLTYTINYRDISLKLMGSYGRATRPPSPESRLEIVRTYAGWNPFQYVYQFANPDLRPEYSRGPQGGIELYWGNVGSLSINHYKQVVTDLIQFVRVDSLFMTRIDDGYEMWNAQFQEQNTAQIRQMGWEGVGGVSLGPLGIRGTYSWNDSRILKQYGTGAPGGPFYGVPTHSGNIIFSFSQGKTSVTIANNWIGAKVSANRNNDDRIYYLLRYARLRMYGIREDRWTTGKREPAYMKSDLSAAQRVSRNLNVTLNMVNLGNAFASDVGQMNPALGRQTTIGFSYRFGR